MNRDDQNEAKPERGGTILYDAECGLCRNCVQWLRKRDGRGHLRFEPLQSEVGQSYLRQLGLPNEDFDSMVWVADSFYWRRARWRGVTAPKEEPCNSVGALLRTDALIAALKFCGGLAWVVGTLLGFIPRPLRDVAYKMVARLRHLFG